MRVLMLSQFYPPVIGGEERHVISLSAALVNRGHEVAVATMPHPDRPAVADVNGVAVHSLQGALQRVSGLFSERERPHAPPFPDPELTARLARLVAEFKPDVVHGHNWMTLQYMPLKLACKAPLVWTLHDYSLVCSVKSLMRKGRHCDGPQFTKCSTCASRHYGRVKGSFVSAMHFATRSWRYGATDQFIAVSRAVAERSELPLGSKPYEVIPTFIADDLAARSNEIDPRLRRLPPDGFLLFVGELNRNKGLQIVLQAYERLEGAPPLVLIGRRNPSTPDNLPANVHLFESWPHAAVMGAWGKCLFGLSPSTWLEPCATVVAESAVVGKTMIATNHGGYVELIEHGVTGLHVPANDVAALAKAMQTLIDNPELRMKLERGALAKAEQFKAKSVVPRIESVYRQALARKTPMSSGAAQIDAVQQSDREFAD